MSLRRWLSVAVVVVAALIFGLICWPRPEAPEEPVSKKRSAVAPEPRKELPVERPVRPGRDLPVRQLRQMLMQTCLVKGPPELSAVLGLGAGAGEQQAAVVLPSDLNWRKHKRIRELQESGALTITNGPRILMMEGGTAEFYIGAPKSSFGAQSGNKFGAGFGNQVGAKFGVAQPTITERLDLKTTQWISLDEKIEIELQGTLLVPAVVADAKALKRETAAKIKIAARIKLNDGETAALKLGDAPSAQTKQADASSYVLIITVEVQP